MPQMGPPPQAPMGPPPIPPEIEQVLAMLPPEIAEIARQMPPDLLMAFLSAPDEGTAMAILQQFVQGMPAPAGLVGPDGMPLPPPMPPGAGAPVEGGPPPMPGPPMMPPPPGPGGAVGPVAIMPDGSQSLMPQQPMPEQPKPIEPLIAPDEKIEAPEDDEPEVKRPDPPDYELPALPTNLYGSQGPSAARVESDATQAERVHAERDYAIALWHDMYYQVPDFKGSFNQKRKNPYKSENQVPSTQTTMADRAIGLVSPTNERLTYKSQPPDDSPASRDANQAKRNAAKTIRERLVRRHVRRVSNDGHIRPSIERVEAGTMVIEGSMPALIDMNPADKNFPWTYEPLPVHEVYPMGHATLRIFRTTLGQLRSMYPKEVNKAYPLDDPKMAYAEEAELKVIGWSDELWHGVWASMAPYSSGNKTTRGRRPPTDREKKEDSTNGVWIKPMKRHNNGWRVYQYGLPALGSPLTPTGQEIDVASMHGVRGIYAAYVPLFRLQARIMSAVAEGAFKSVRPPYKVKLANPHDPPPKIDDGPGGKGVVLKPGEDVEPMLQTMMDTKSGQTLLEFISVMLGEMMPPVSQGRGQAASGADRFIAQRQAAALHIDPIISGIEQTLSYYTELMLEGFYRKAKGTGGWLTAVPIRQHSRAPEDAARGNGATMAMLIPDDIARCGPEITIKYRRYSIEERMQLGQMLKGMVDAKFMSRMEAMDELDVEDYERTVARQLMEAVYEDPDMVKASIDAILEENADDDGKKYSVRERAHRRAVRVSRAWKKRQAEEKAKGSAPAPVGTPPPPGVPEMSNMPGLPPGDMQQ